MSGCANDDNEEPRVVMSMPLPPANKRSMRRWMAACARIVARVRLETGDVVELDCVIRVSAAGGDMTLSFAVPGESEHAPLPAGGMLEVGIRRGRVRVGRVTLNARPVNE